MKRDVGGERARAGRIVELHGNFLPFYRWKLAANRLNAVAWSSQD
jgi:hypothetical protein